MGKTFHFLTGLHRSGNTVLSAILNQHPDIYVSPISSLIEHMWVCHNTVETFESAMLNDLDKQRSIDMISGIPDNYYKDIEKSIVFDRQKSWINQPNIDIIKKYVNKNSKIIFTTRPILECIASYIAIDRSTIIDNLNRSNFKINKNLTENENIADFLISDHSTFGFTRLLAMKSIDNPNNAGTIHTVKYEDLINTPQNTMNKIYEFLELESFKHNFNNIRKLEEYNEFVLGLAKDLHNIRKVLGRSNIKIENYLTPYTIDKYKDLRYF